MAAVLGLFPQDSGLEEMAAEGRWELLTASVMRNLRGPGIDAAAFDRFWTSIGARRWEGRLGEFLASWDKTVSPQSEGAGPFLFRARLETLRSESKARELLDALALRFPDEPAVHWFVAQTRFEAGDAPASARALERLNPAQGWPRDRDHYHRLLAQVYASTGARPAAVEHLRAMDRVDDAGRAALASRCGLAEEAARLWASALAGDPERISLHLQLIRTLQDAGDRDGAAAERAKVYTVNGRFDGGRLEDYFFLLPPDGRPAEVVRTLKVLLSTHADPSTQSAVFAQVVSSVPNEDRSAVRTAWETTVGDARGWVVLARMQQQWGEDPTRALETLEKGERLHPGDALFPYEKIEPFKAIGKYASACAAYKQLIALDPEASKTGPRPSTKVRDIIKGMGPEDGGGASLALGVIALLDRGMTDADRVQIRTGLKPIWDSFGPGFWEQVRKLELPAADATVETAVRGQILKLSDDEFEVRSEASKALIKLGLPAISMLLKRIDDTDPEVRSRVRDVIRAMLSE